MSVWGSSYKVRDAFLDDLYIQCSEYLYKLAWELSSGAQDVDDLVQTVWVKLIAKEQTLRTLSHPQRLNYISKTMKNTLREDARKKKLIICSLDAVVGYDSGHIDDVIDVIDKEIQRRMFSEAWALVNDDVRELLERKYDLEETDEEIALAMGIKVGSVRMYLTRAKRAARTVIAEYIDKSLG